MAISLFSRLLDFISPRTCVICGNRLTVTEGHICGVCIMRLPRTHFHLTPYENKMAENFYVLVKKLGKAAAFFYYHPHSKSTKIILSLKYGDNPAIGITLGRLMATEMQPSGFFDDVDVMLPMPLTRKRRWSRGYNQSEQIAQGISQITHIPLLSHAVRRTSFKRSQTQLHRRERMENVEGVFALRKNLQLKNKHVLIIDDVCTTGATIIALANTIQEAGVKEISILTAGFTQA